jgi:hypothetical protein
VTYHAPLHRNGHLKNTRFSTGPKWWATKNATGGIGAVLLDCRIAGWKSADREIGHNHVVIEHRHPLVAHRFAVGFSAWDSDRGAVGYQGV